MIARLFKKDSLMLVCLYMQVVSVIPLKKTSVFETLTYFSTEPLSAGTLVSVKLRGKSIKAMVTDVEEIANVKSAVKNADFVLRPIESVLGPIFVRETYRTLIDHIASTNLAKKKFCLSYTHPRFVLHTQRRSFNQNKSTDKNKIRHRE